MTVGNRALRGPTGATGPCGPKGDSGITLPTPVGEAMEFSGLTAVNKNTGRLEEVRWDDILVLLLQKLGLKPGDRLVVRRCDGTTNDIPLDILNEQFADKIHSA